MFMVINLSRVGIYSEEFSFIKPPDPLILWSCKGTWIILPAVSLLPQDLWPLNLKKLWLTLKNLIRQFTEREIAFLGKFDLRTQIFQFELKFGIQTNLNMLNLEVVFTFPVLDDLSGNLVQKLKIVKFKLKFKL